ncbi:MAG TPA: phosphomethylpyrimidine synthase ThiC, partial [Thiomicrospira sp.]|nr:phosphomethylpyrimidine synthase ThiC [Thiomicrospira sp.]
MSSTFKDSLPASNDILTTHPLPASKKIYLGGKIHPEIRVPLREITLTNGDKVTVYDTSGAYTDPNIEIDVVKGLPPIRKDWITKRGDVEEYEG